MFETFAVRVLDTLFYMSKGTFLLFQWNTEIFQKFSHQNQLRMAKMLLYLKEKNETFC